MSIPRTNKSAAIRYLASRNWSIRDIADFLEVRYQFAWNVAHRASL